MVDIKAEGIGAEDLDAMKAHAGSYEALFSRRAMKFRSMGLADQNLSEPTTVDSFSRSTPS